jgi:hypothetical protein
MARLRQSLIRKSKTIGIRLHHIPSQASRWSCLRLVLREAVLKIRRGRHKMAFGCYCPSRNLHAGYEVLGAEMNFLYCVTRCRGRRSFSYVLEDVLGRNEERIREGGRVDKL